MTEIHMETENVREAAQQVDLLAGDLYFQPGKLNNLGNDLSGAWQGGKSGRFAARIHKLAELVKTETIRLQRLAISARAEVGEWEARDADTEWSSIPQIQLIPTGWLDPYRDLIKDENADTYRKALWKVGLIGALCPLPLIGDVVSLVADAESGEVQFRQWVVEDWEEYNSLGEELAATIYDFLFVYIRNSIVLGLDTANLATEILELLEVIPGAGFLVNKAVDLIFWALGDVSDKGIEAAYNSLEESGMKDMFVKALGEQVNNGIVTVDSDFNPAIQQILTAPEWSGVSGSW